MFPLREYLSTLKKDKTPENANRIIRFIRLNWQPLVSQSEAEIGMNYLLGKQDMTFIKDLFQNTTRINLTNETKPLVNGFGQPIHRHGNHDEFMQKEMSAVHFKPLPIMEHLRNVLVAEMKKMGPVVSVRSEDPTSVEKRIRDKALIENKEQIEADLSYIYSSIGLAPFRMKDHKDRFGEKADSGNTELFAAMGLNPNDPSDVDFFMKNFHKLDEEIAAQEPIDYCMSYNHVDLEIQKWVNDALAKKAMAAICWVDEVTGATVYRYLAPETVYIYGGGNGNDFNDANAKGYERKVTIKEMLSILGNSFDMDKEWDNILLAITNTMNLEFTGVKPSYRGFVSGAQQLRGTDATPYNYDQFMSFKVTLGYIEYTLQNQETFGEIRQEGSYYENNMPPEGEGKYASQARWETPTYKAHYLAISSVDQIMFNWGELPYNDIEGYSDVNINYTICTYKEVGDPLAIIAAPFLDLMNEAWYKFRYEIRRAKPAGFAYNYDSVAETLMDLIPDTNISQMNKFQKVMEMLDGSANIVYKTPVINGQVSTQAGPNINYPIPNGLTKEVMQWWEIVVSIGEYLSQSIMGIAPLREGDPGPARDSMNNQFKALEYSQATTYYVPDMLTYLFQQLAVKTNFFVQDIVTYKTHNTVAYKFWEDAVGKETLNKIENIGKVSLHRLGIFVESLNQTALRQKLEAALQKAIDNKAINTGEYMLISDLKSPKKAFLTLAYFEQRNKKMADQAIQAQQAQQQQGQMAIEQMKQKTEMIKGDYSVMVAKIQSESTEKSDAIKQEGGITKTILKHHSDIEQIVQQSMADIKKMMAENNTAQNQPTPNIPQPPVPQQPQPSRPLPPIQTGQSPAKLRQEVQPQPTVGMV